MMNLEHELRRLAKHVEELYRRVRRTEAEAEESDEECSTSSPQTVGSGTEGSEAADTGSWAADGSTPVNVWVVSRVGYFEAGNETLYAYMRRLDFDSCGKLVAVGAETRVEVDVPESCT